MMRRFDKIIQVVKKIALDLFSREEMTVLPLQMTRITEKFDIVIRPPFRGGVSMHVKP